MLPWQQRCILKNHDDNAKFSESAISEFRTVLSNWLVKPRHGHQDE